MVMRQCVDKTKKILRNYTITEEGYNILPLIEGRDILSYTKEGFYNKYTPLIDKIESLDEYQILAARTLPELVPLYNNSEADTIHMLFGMDTEIGEILDLYKKSFAYRKVFDRVNLVEEVCDYMWYFAGFYTIRNIKLSIVIQNYLLDSKYLSGLLIPDGDFPTVNEMKSVRHDLANLLIVDYKTILFNFITSKEELFKGLTNNINKLIIRYPDKFSNEDAVNRNLSEERKQLEK